MKINPIEIIKFQNKILKKASIYQLTIALILATLDVIQVYLLALVFSGKKELNFFSNFNETDQLNFDKYLYLVISLLLIIKYLVSFIINNKSHKINFYFQKNLMSKLIMTHFGEPLEKIYKSDVRKSLKIYQKDSDDVCYQIFNQMVYIYSDLMIFFGLILIVLYTNFQSALIILLFGLLYYLLSHFIKNKYLNNILEQKNRFEAAKFEIINEAILNSAQAKYFRTQGYFFQKLEKIINKLAKVSIQEYSLRDLERHLFELGLLLSLIYVAGKSIGIHSSTFFIIAILRIGMSGIKLTSYFNQIKQNLYKLNNIVKLIKIDVKENNNQGKRDIVSTIDYSGAVNFSIASPGIYLIKGISGSGKTSILNELIGFKRSDNNLVKINNINNNLSEVIVGLCTQDKKILIDTIEANITYGKPIDKIKLEESIKFSSLDTINLDKFLDLGVSSISGGEAQRICLARAYYQNESNLLLLDEPMTGLDSININNIFIKILDYSKENIVIIITHDNIFDKHAKLICNV